MKSRRSIALVAARYGEEVVGGAERLARQIALRLSECCSVEVVTTCAVDYRTWQNEYPEGVSREREVQIRRFPVIRNRSWRRFGRLSRVIYTWNRLVSPPFRLQQKWLEAQGPFCPSLVDYLSDNRQSWDAVLFFTYLYYPTAAGISRVAERAILVPTAHDEPPIYLSLLQEVFHSSRHLIFLTESEEALVRRFCPAGQVPGTVVSMGVEIKQPQPPNDFFLYAGRIEAGKNCGELFEFCRRTGVSLKAIGPALMEVPSDVDYLGVVSEEMKEELFSRCRGVFIPSRLESLSIAALEAWCFGKPVVAHSGSPVLVDLIERSGGGVTYGDLLEFRRGLEICTEEMGQKGRRWVRENCSWERVLAGYREVIDRVAREAG